MNRLIALIGVAVVVGAATVFSNAEEEPRKSEIATFEHVQQDKDYRVSLLEVTKGMTYLDAQELMSDVGRPPGKTAVPWIRVTTAIERLTNKKASDGFKAETADGTKLAGRISMSQIRIKKDSQLSIGDGSGVVAIDLMLPLLRAAVDQAETPEDSSPMTEVHFFTLSGKNQASDTFTFRVSFGNEGDRREFVFRNIAMP